MWKYISSVPKVVEEKKKEKNPKAAHDSKDSKEYEKNRKIQLQLLGQLLNLRKMKMKSYSQRRPMIMTKNCCGEQLKH